MVVLVGFVGVVGLLDLWRRDPLVTVLLVQGLLEEERGAYVKVWDEAAWYVTVREGRQRRNQVGFTLSRDQKRE